MPQGSPLRDPTPVSGMSGLAGAASVGAPQAPPMEPPPSAHTSMTRAPHGAPGSQPPMSEPSPHSWKLFFIPAAFTLGFLAFTFFPPVRGNPRLEWTFYGVAAAVFTWQVILWAVVRTRQQTLRMEFVPVASHWVQACVQFSIMLYWGWFWREVYAELPLIASQVVYFYILDALFSWSRGRSWRIGFGPLPIVISTNLLLWFVHDWYFLQFAMLTVGILGKQFITWTRDGRRTHIFNPSAFGQFLFAVALIATGTTNELTKGSQIAETFDPPGILLVIFLGGLVVQSLFHVTLMTFAATATLVVANLIYTEVTGVYVFVNINIAGPIFLGMHLLITDPATSPRTNMGRVLFGALYGLSYLILFRVLDVAGVPIFWDKLLPVPILNLCVPLFDRMMRTGLLGRVNTAWETALKPRAMNLVHMGLWSAMFLTMLGTGFIEAPHPGNSIPFWKQAVLEGKPHAGPSLVRAAGSQAELGPSGAAWNELGLICMEGTIIPQNRAAAAKHFAMACDLNDESGCVNVALQFLFLREWRSEEDVALALERLENDCQSNGSGRSCYLVGVAYETGRGRPKDPIRALQFFESAGLDNVYAAKGAARVFLTTPDMPLDMRPVVQTLVDSARRGDAESCWYLAYMYRDGVGTAVDVAKARSLLETGCKLGLADACKALEAPELPPYRNPPMSVPGWATAFPIENAAPATSGAP